MKRYAVFGGSNYYPSGGMGDFCESFDTMEEAECYVEELKKDSDWQDIEDMESYG